MYLSTNHAPNRSQKGVTFIYSVTAACTKVREMVDLAPVLQNLF